MLERTNALWCEHSIIKPTTDITPDCAKIDFLNSVRFHGNRQRSLEILPWSAIPLIVNVASSSTFNLWHRSISGITSDIWYQTPIVSVKMQAVKAYASPDEFNIYIDASYSSMLSNSIHTALHYQLMRRYVIFYLSVTNIRQCVPYSVKDVTKCPMSSSKGGSPRNSTS